MGPALFLTSHAPLAPILKRGLLMQLGTPFLSFGSPYRVGVWQYGQHWSPQCGARGRHSTIRHPLVANLRSTVPPIKKKNQECRQLPLLYCFGQDTSLIFIFFFCEMGSHGSFQRCHQNVGNPWAFQFLYIPPFLLGAQAHGLSSSQQPCDFPCVGEQPPHTGSISTIKICWDKFLNCFSKPGFLGRGRF